MVHLVRDTFARNAGAFLQPHVSQAPGQGQGLKCRAAGCSDKQPATTSASPYAVAIIRKMCLGREGKVFAYLVQTRCPPGQTACAAMWARAPGPARRLLLGLWSELVNDTLGPDQRVSLTRPLPS